MWAALQRFATTCWLHKTSRHFLLVRSYSAYYNNRSDMHNKRNSSFTESLIPVLREKQRLESLSLSFHVTHSSVQLTQEEENAEIRDGGSLTKSCVSSELSDVSFALSTVMTGINTDRRRGRSRWRDVCSMVCLWFSYLFIYSAISIIAPFFPGEVP